MNALDIMKRPDAYVSGYENTPTEEQNRAKELCCEYNRTAPNEHADTESKSNGVSALFYQRTGPQHRFFSRAATAVDKAYQLDVVLAFKSALSFPDGTKIPASGAVILCLHTTDNTKFHIVFLLK